MDHRQQLLLHGLGIVVVGILGYLHVLPPEVISGLIVGLVVPSPVGPLRAMVAGEPNGK